MIASEQIKIWKWPPIPMFEVWIGAVAIYAGLSHFLPDLLHPSGTARAVAIVFPGIANVWSVLYAVGGAAILVGLYRRSPRIEGAGVCLLGAGITVATLAAIAANSAILPALIVQGGAVLACVGRVYQLQRLP